MSADFLMSESAADDSRTGRNVPPLRQGRLRSAEKAHESGGGRRFVFALAAAVIASAGIALVAADPVAAQNAAGAAADAATAPAGPTPAGFITSSVIFFLMGLSVYWLLYLRPLQQTELERKQFLEKLKKGDEVVTSGGIFGKVVQVKPDGVTVEIAPGVKVRVRAIDIQQPAAAGAREEPAKPEPREIARS